MVKELLRNGPVPEHVRDEMAFPMPAIPENEFTFTNTDEVAKENQPPTPGAACYSPFHEYPGEKEKGLESSFGVDDLITAIASPAKLAAQKAEGLWEKAREEVRDQIVEKGTELVLEPRETATEWARSLTELPDKAEDVVQKVVDAVP